LYSMPSKARYARCPEPDYIIQVIASGQWCSEESAAHYVSRASREKALLDSGRYIWSSDLATCVVSMNIRCKKYQAGVPAIGQAGLKLQDYTEIRQLLHMPPHCLFLSWLILIFPDLLYRTRIGMKFKAAEIKVAG